MQLCPVKTAIFAVYYVCNIIFLLVMTGWIALGALSTSRSPSQKRRS